MHDIYFSLCLIFFGLAAGYTIQVLVSAGKMKLSFSLDILRKRIQRFVLLIISPVTVVGAIWIMDLGDIRIAVLPLIGVLHFLIGGSIAIVAAKMLKLGRKETGSFFSCGFFTNIGSVGGLVLYSLLGESGFALMPVYKMLGELVYYGIGFPVAKYFGTSAVSGEGPLEMLKKVGQDIFVRVSIISIALGAMLNIFDIGRPAVYSSVNSVLIPLNALLMLVAIGLAMHFSKVKDYIRESIVMCVVKFVIMPVILGSIAVFAGLGDLMGGLALRVVIILSFMPVAFTALIPPSIYDLDLDLANACWLVTTAGLVVVVPALSILADFFS
jgi:predicted permease